MTMTQIAIVTALSLAVPKSFERGTTKQIDFAFSFSRAVHEQPWEALFPNVRTLSPRLDDGRLLSELSSDNVAPSSDIKTEKGQTFAFMFSRACLRGDSSALHLDEDVLSGELAARARLIDAELTKTEEQRPTPPLAEAINCEATPGSTVIVPTDRELAIRAWTRCAGPPPWDALSAKLASLAHGNDADAPQRLQVCSNPTIVEEQIEDGFPGTGHGLPQNRVLIDRHSASLRCGYFICEQVVPGVKNTKPTAVFEVALKPIAAATQSLSDSQPESGELKPTEAEALLSDGFAASEPSDKPRPEPEISVPGGRIRVAPGRAENRLSFPFGEKALQELKEQREALRYSNSLTEGVTMRFVDEGATIYR